MSSHISSVRLDLTHTKQLPSKPSQSMTSSLEKLLNPKGPGGAVLGAEWTGWLDPELPINTLKEIEAVFSRPLPSYDSVVVVGIGGSYLGLKALIDLESKLNPTSIYPLFFLGNHLSTLEYRATLAQLNTPLFVIVSKSGTTLEPAIAYRMLAQKFGEREDFFDRLLFVTDASKGHMRAFANKNNLRTCQVPDNVGGRFSVFTGVGMLPFALLQKSTPQKALARVKQILDAAAEEFAAVRSLRTEYPAASYASLRDHLQQSGKDLEVFACTEPALLGFCQFLQQLYGESEAKNQRGLFPTVFQYTADLHSLGQYLQDGKRIFFQTFHEYLAYDDAHDSLNSRVSCVSAKTKINDGFDVLEGMSLHEVNRRVSEASREAHALSGVSSLVIESPTLSTQQLAKWIVFHFIACAVYCDARGINAFDQPGVEQYKKSFRDQLVHLENR